MARSFTTSISKSRPAKQKKATSTRRASRASSRASKRPSSTTARSATASCRSRKSPANIFRRPAGARQPRQHPRTLLQEGQELIVQVEKEERGNKGAALTTFISLAGRFLVLMPNNPRAGGVSRRIEGEDRDAAARRRWTACRSPTAWARSSARPASGRRPEELQWDLDNLATYWDADRQPPQATARPRSSIYQESDAVTRALRDYLVRRHRRNPDRRAGAPTSEAQEYMQRFMPSERAAPAEALRRRRAALHALPDREPDRVGVLAHGARCPPAAAS